jgi:predicted TIM-barrel fold metal-dependent hydrolase
MATSALSIIDTDIHERAELDALVPYLDKRFRHYITESGWVPDRVLPYTQLTAGGLDRADAKTPDGRPGGSDLGMLQEQVLDEYGHEWGILTGWLNSSAFHPGWAEFKSALMTAYNDWQIENWLDKDDRLAGSIHVNIHDPSNAVREIERLADHPRMVQVMLYIGPTDSPFGEPIYHPIYEAAARHNLVVGIHHSENSRTALGFHRYFIEWHTLVPQVFMSEVVSLVFNGVFDANPNLKVIMIEGGFSYVPHLMWKMDQQYRELRAEVPWVKRMPSDIVREQIRFATQPVEEFTWAQFSQLIDQMGSEDLLCFSTDYPHWDFDSPLEALPADMPDDLKRKIFSENARAIYERLPAKAPAVA